MTGYIVCPACGSRMKAGRGHCLRCFETLPVDAPEAPQQWLSQGRTLIVGVVLTLGALLVGAVIWERATPAVDDVARPAPSTPNVISQKASAPAVPNETLGTSAGRPPVLEPGFIKPPRPENTPDMPPDVSGAFHTKPPAKIRSSGER